MSLFNAKFYDPIELECNGDKELVMKFAGVIRMTMWHFTDNEEHNCSSYDAKRVGQLPVNDLEFKVVRLMFS